MLLKCVRVSFIFFFFQAEEGIRDYKVTGVQTCALPICFQDLSKAAAKSARPRPAKRTQRPKPAEPVEPAASTNRSAPEELAPAPLPDTAPAVAEVVQPEPVSSRVA